MRLSTFDEAGMSDRQMIFWYIKLEIEDRGANNWVFDELLIGTDVCPLPFRPFENHAHQVLIMTFEGRNF